MRWAVSVAFVVMFMSVNVAAAHADTPMVECPDTHAHVWHQDQCSDISSPFGIPGSGHGGGGGGCGGLCGLVKAIGGLL